MRFGMRRGPISLLILTSTALLCSACVSTRPLLVQSSACSSLIPLSLRADVPSVQLPGVTANAGDVWVALDGQTGRLDEANIMKAAAISIVEACEARDRQTAAHLTRPWWAFWR